MLKHIEIGRAVLPIKAAGNFADGDTDMFAEHHYTWHKITPFRFARFSTFELKKLYIVRGDVRTYHAKFGANPTLPSPLQSRGLKVRRTLYCAVFLLSLSWSYSY